MSPRKKVTGRPYEGRDEAKILVRMTAQEKEALEKLSQYYALNQSETIRFLVDKELGRTKKTIDEQAEMDREEAKVELKEEIRDEVRAEILAEERERMRKELLEEVGHPQSAKSRKAS